MHECSINLSEIGKKMLILKCQLKPSIFRVDLVYIAGSIRTSYAQKNPSVFIQPCLVLFTFGWGTWRLPNIRFRQTWLVCTNRLQCCRFNRNIVPIFFAFLSLKNMLIGVKYRRTSNYWIALGEKTSVYRGTRGSRRSTFGRNENLKERLSSCR